MINFKRNKIVKWKGHYFVVPRFWTTKEMMAADLYEERHK